MITRIAIRGVFMPDVPQLIDDETYYRSIRWTVRCALHDPAPSGVTSRIVEAVAALPPFQRVPIELNLGQGITQLDIAEQLGISDRTVQRAIYDGIRAIAEKVYGMSL